MRNDQALIPADAAAFGSAADFLAQVRDVSNACILLDINMPHMSGLEFAAQLKVRGIEVPVIAISGRDDDDVGQLIHDLGLSFFLHKPVDDQALIDAILWVTKKNYSVKTSLQ